MASSPQGSSSNDYRCHLGSTRRLKKFSGVRSRSIPVRRGRKPRVECNNTQKKKDQMKGRGSSHSDLQGSYETLLLSIRTWLLANPGRGQLHCTEKMFFPLSPFAPDVPRQPAHSPYSGWTWCLLTGFLPISAVASIYISEPLWCVIVSVPSLPGHTQLRTDGVHCRESAGTGPV